MEPFTLSMIEGTPDAEEREQLREILLRCDDDFYPPLSARSGINQQDLSPKGCERAGSDPGLVQYTEQLMRQELLVVKREGRIVGFTTFRTGYRSSVVPEFGEAAYVTTVCVLPEYRGRGLLRRMYDFLEREAPRRFDDHAVLLRTWSMNKLHIHALQNRGYQILTVLKDDRGEGVDTLYFGKRLG